MKRISISIACFLSVLNAGCKQGESAGEKVLNIYIFTEYLPQPVIDEFTKQTGIKVNVAFCGANEEILDKLQSGVSEFDIVVPSDYMVRRLAAKGLIQKLDRSKLRGFANLDPKFLNQKFDPGNVFSIPYFWGTTGIGYNKAKLPQVVDSWAVMFDPKYKGQILMLNDGREAFSAALEKMGKSPNTTDPAALAEAGELLKQQKPLVKLYDSDTFAEKLAGGDVALAHGYNGQFAKVMMEKPNLAFVTPKEGATFWMDNLCIASKAGHAANALTFLNYVLGPEVSAMIANDAGYGSPNAAARKYMKPELLKNSIIYPPDDVLARCKFLEDLGEANRIVENGWTDIKAQ